MAQELTLSPHSFLRLRLVAFFGLAVLLSVAVFTEALNIPVFPVAFFLCCIPLSHLFYDESKHTASIKTLILLDSAILTGLLYYSGGAANPFSVLYLVYVVLAAVMLGNRWAWIMALVTSLCFAFLFSYHAPVADMHQMHTTGLSTHLYGMLISYVLVAALVAYFLSKIVTERKRQELRLQKLDADQKKLALVTTWAASAAHKLGTPLSTMSVIAHELAQHLEGDTQFTAKELRDDILLLQSETKRCQKTIDELCHRAGSIRGEMPVWTSLTAFFATTLDQYEGQYRLTLEGGQGHCEYQLPCRALAVAVEELVNNAIYAQQKAGVDLPVQISAGVEDKVFTIQVRDHGAGIPEEKMSLLCEPFISDKPLGQGMGLGVYITDLVVRSLQGVLVFDSAKPQGTLVTITVPVRQVRQQGQAA